MTLTIAYNNRPVSDILKEFIMLSALPALHSMAVTIASVPIGQWALLQLDFMLSVINEALSWSAKNKENQRSVSWLVFFPLLVAVQNIRFLASMALFMVWGKTISNEEVKELIDSIRSELHEIMSIGKSNIEDSAGVNMASIVQYVTTTALFIFHSIISLWPITRRLAIIKAEEVVCFIGRIKEITWQTLRPFNPVESDNNANTHSEQPESDNPEHYKEHHHQEHHHQEHHHQEHHQ